MHDIMFNVIERKRYISIVLNISCLFHFEYVMDLKTFRSISMNVSLHVCRKNLHFLFITSPCKSCIYIISWKWCWRNFYTRNTYFNRQIECFCLCECWMQSFHITFVQSYVCVCFFAVVFLWTVGFFHTKSL